VRVAISRSHVGETEDLLAFAVPTAGSVSMIDLGISFGAHFAGEGNKKVAGGAGTGSASRFKTHSLFSASASSSLPIVLSPSRLGADPPTILLSS